MYKDTAKWLLAFLPIPTFLALGLSLGPRFAAIEEVGIVHWVSRYWVSSVAIGLILVAALALIGMCCWVLLAAPSEWATLTADTNWMSRAFSTYAIGIPTFTDAKAFSDTGLKVLSAEATGDEVKAITDTTQRLVALSADLNARARFATFVWALPVCALVVVVGLFVLGAALPVTPDAITKPTKVSIFMSPGAEAEFVTATGCTCLHSTTAIAVHGMWDRPTLRLFGKGCTDNEWAPQADMHAVIAPA